MTTRILLRRGTEALWTSTNPILAEGEIGYETDTGKFKIGNGTDTWTARPYYASDINITDGAPGSVLTTDGAGNFSFVDYIGTLSTSDLAEGSNLYFTNERVDDRVSSLLVGGTNVTLTYNDAANTLTIATSVPIGYTGSQGDQGDQGLRGYTGSLGSIGYTGSLGEIGYTGSIGFAGSRGFTGSQGDTGELGFSGSRGFTGSQGVLGPLGYTGSQGTIPITFSPTPPASPSVGDLWGDTS